MKFIRRGFLWRPSTEMVTPQPTVSLAKRVRAAGVQMFDGALGWFSGVKVAPEHISPTPAKALGQLAATYPYTLDHTLVWFGPRDPWRISDACEGTQVTGEPGAGKTTGSGQTLAKAFLRAGFGGLVLTKKVDELDTWIRYCQETGRLDSLLIVHPRQPWRLNCLAYHYDRPGEASGLTQNAVSMFMNVLEARSDGGRRNSSESFWTEGTRKLLRYSLDALIAARQPITMENLKRILDGVPYPYLNNHTGEHAWPKDSFLNQCLKGARQARQAGRMEIPAQEIDPDEIQRYFEKDFARPGSDRQSAGILSTFTGMAEPFLGPGPVRELFTTTTNFYPEWSRLGAVIILALPLDEWEEAGRTAQLTFKYIWQRAITRRQGLPPGERPVFLWVDEAQCFATPYDKDFQDAARSSVACTVYLTQNISGYYAAMEPMRGKDQTAALMGNLATKIFHRNGDRATNEWAAETIGKDVILRYSGNDGVSDGVTEGDNSGTTITMSGEQIGLGITWGNSISRSVTHSFNHGWFETFDYLVPPVVFTRLKGGGPENNYEVQGIVFKAGKQWRRTGRTFIDVTFRQRGV